MRSVLDSVRQFSAGLRMLLVFTVVLGVAFPLAVTAVAQLPGLRSRADGSQLTHGGEPAGSALLGQTFTDDNGNALVQYFQSRPSAAGDGYDPTASSASNLGPESVVDAGPDDPSLLTQVCTRSEDVGEREGVDGSRPFCSPDGTGSVLAVFWSGPGYAGHVTRVVSVNQWPGSTPFVATYRGVRVELAQPGVDYAAGQVVPVRGDAPADPAVPSDALTASGSGLDPEISPAYARIQEARVARARGVTVAQVAAVVARNEAGRDLGFLGEPRVNVLKLNLAVDQAFPFTG